MIFVMLWQYRNLIAMAALAAVIGFLLIGRANDHAALAGKQADIDRLSGVVSGLNAQVTSLQGAVADRDHELAEKDKLIAAGDAVVADATKAKERAADEAVSLRKDIKNARDDADAFQLLAGGLCGYEARLAALHAGNADEDGTSADPAAAGAPGAACTGPIGGTGREIADYALRFAITAVQASEQIVGIGKYQAQHNAIVAAK